MEYITSDLHLNHDKICGPDGFVPTRTHFDSVEEMDNYLIQAHNSVVNKYDVLYHLGDFSFNISREKVFEILNNMNGQIHFIKGNHDGQSILNHLNSNNYELKKGMNKFVTHEVGLIVKRNKKIYHLTHYPLNVGEGRGKLRSLCGHIHELAAEQSNILNVGIDSPELPEGHPFGVPLRFDVACELVENKIKIFHKKS